MRSANPGSGVKDERCVTGPLLERGMTDDVFTPHPIERLLDKPAADFTCDDLISTVEKLELRQVNLRYVGGDGRLKKSPSRSARAST